MHWLAKTKAWVDNMNDIHMLRAMEEDAELKAAKVWIERILRENCLEENVGKEATRIWMYDDLDDFTQIGRAFRLGLKYYMRTEIRMTNVEAEIETLCSTQFRNIIL